MNLKNALFWTPLSLAGKLQFCIITNYGESNESKKIFTSHIDDKNTIKNNCTFIEINHYKDDKLLKTENLSSYAFLNGFDK